MSTFIIESEKLPAVDPETYSVAQLSQPISDNLDTATKKTIENSSEEEIISAPALSPFIAEDHEFIKEYLPKAAIITLTKDFITVVIIRTPYSRVQLRVQYLPNYPDEVPLIELTSPTLPTPLLRLKEKECMEKARVDIGKPQVRAIYEHIYQFIQTNMFIPCWKEMKQVAALCEGRGQLGADEKEGILQLRLTEGAYRQTVKLKVPPMYPEEGVQVEFTTSNFPAAMQYMFRSQTEVREDNNFYR
jgi:hypothetical protein